MGLVNKIGMTFLLRDVNRFKFGHLPNGVLSLDYRPCGQRVFVGYNPLPEIICPLGHVYLLIILMIIITIGL